jgi:hypothetical protein
MRVIPISYRKLGINRPKDTLTGGISVEVVYGEENVRLIVSDTGVGIPPQGTSTHCHPIQKPNFLQMWTKFGTDSIALKRLHVGACMGYI